MILTFAAVLLDIVMHLHPIRAQAAAMQVFIDQQSASVSDPLKLRGTTVLGFSCTTASCYVLNQ
jgi:hypothetical protein